MTYDMNNKEEMKTLRNAMNYKVENVRIVDPKADNPEDVQDSYVGKYVAKCDVCNQLVYLDTDELTDENNICPHCKFDNCLVMVGLISALPVHDAKCVNKDVNDFDNNLSSREAVYGKCYKDGFERK